MKIKLLTVNFYSGRFTELLAHSVFKLNKEADIEMTIFDNGSSDGSLDFVDNFAAGTINVITADCPYPLGSASHGFAVDKLLQNTDYTNCDVVCLVDSDCFSFEQKWLIDRVLPIFNGDLDIVGAKAYCPTELLENQYLWPGFSLYSADIIAYILSNRLSCVPDGSAKINNDSGQILSNELVKEGFKIQYLDRTPANKVGTVQLEKWSIDTDIHHFFAASTTGGVTNPFAFIYGDRSRGRYIYKMVSAWRLFQQSKVRQLMGES